MKHKYYFLLITMSQVFAESAENLAQKAQNPIASMISLPFQNNTNFKLGPNNRTQDILNIQPVIPMAITKEWNLITRTIIPVIYQPTLSACHGSHSGVGDINPSLFLSPSKEASVTWGAGATFLIPTATHKSLGTGKWGAGPTAVVLTMPGHWVLGILANNIWSFAGQKKRKTVNVLTIQPFLNYNFSKGWYVTSSPIVNSDWTIKSRNRWIVPIGGGFGRIFNIGKQPVNAQIQSFYNIKRPEGASKWQLRLQFQFLFPK